MSEVDDLLTTFLTCSATAVPDLERCEGNPTR